MTDESVSECLFIMDLHTKLQWRVRLCWISIFLVMLGQKPFHPLLAESRSSSGLSRKYD